MMVYIFAFTHTLRQGRTKPQSGVDIGPTRHPHRYRRLHTASWRAPMPPGRITGTGHFTGKNHTNRSQGHTDKHLQLVSLTYASYP